MNKKQNKEYCRTIECHVCGELIEGAWDSQVYLGMETKELDSSGLHRWLIHDKHIKCSPSRAQRIVHPMYPSVIDERPQFDWRRDDGPWDDALREKHKKLYTDAWVRLQERYNPNWDNDVMLKELESLRRQKRAWELQRATWLNQVKDLKAKLVAKMPPSKPYEWDSYDESDSKGISHPTDQTE